MKINLEIIKQSLSDLRAAPSVYEEATEPRNKRQTLAGAIQMYEYTYETALKMIERALYILKISKEELNSLSFDNFIRMAYKKGLVHSSVDIWRTYRKLRNSTSHAYIPQYALEIVEVIPNFVEEIQYLIDRLELLEE